MCDTNLSGQTPFNAQQGFIRARGRGKAGFNPAVGQLARVSPANSAAGVATFEFIAVLLTFTNSFHCIHLQEIMGPNQMLPDYIVTGNQVELGYDY